MNYQRLGKLTVKVLPVVCVAVILLCADIILNKPEPLNANSDMLPLLPKSISQDNSNAQAAGVLALYTKFDVVPDTSNELKADQQKKGNNIPTLAEQERQQGLLRQLYINDKIYRLTAVLKQRRYIANLTVADSSMPEVPPARLALQQGDTLHHYEVVDVSAKRITLRHQQRELWLQLFTTEQDEPTKTMPASETKPG